MDPPTRPTEAWGPSGTAAIAIPLAETVGLRLLAASAAAPDLSFDAAALRSMARSIGGVPGAALDATIADALAYGPGRIDDALDDYARRRRGRVAALTAATEEAAFAARVPEGAGRSLRRLAAARPLAFRHCFGDEARAYAADVPQEL